MALLGTLVLFSFKFICCVLLVVNGYESNCCFIDPTFYCGNGGW